ncbi:hypothetical protein ACVBEQ_25035 [Nakamurella sp. GG22]
MSVMDKAPTAGAPAVSHRELLGWLAINVSPLWMVCAVAVWPTFVEAEVEQPFFWAGVAVCVATTIAVLLAAPRRVTQAGGRLTVQYGSRYTRSIEIGPFATAVWMPQFRTIHHRYGLLVLLDAGNRRVRLDTRLFSADQLMDLAAHAGRREHISDEVTGRWMRRRRPGVLPWRDARPVFFSLAGWALLLVAVFGIPILIGLVPI